MMIDDESYYDIMSLNRIRNFLRLKDESQH